MKTTRRVARKVGVDDELASDLLPEQEPSVSSVKHPAFLKSSKPRKPSHLRTSFTLSGEDAVEDGEEQSVRVVQKANSKRRLLDRGRASLPHRTGASTDRPSYNADTLAELKSSTPSTASNTFPITDDETDPSQDTIDIVSKFGTSAVALSFDHPKPTSDVDGSYIPSSLEIEEKKERRRRLAKEQDFISLDSAGDFNRDIDGRGGDSDSDEERTARAGGPRNNGSLIIPADELEIKSKYAESRLVREDEDMAEGFEEFTEDSGKVTLGRKAAKEQEKERRKAIEEQIRAAQHGYGYGDVSGSDSQEEAEEEVDQEEAARVRAYEAAQTRHGTGAYAANSRRRQEEKDKEEREKRRLELPKTKPVPELKVVVARFGEMVRVTKEGIEEKKRRLARMEREREEIGLEEERVKTLLKEAGEKFENLQREAVEHGGELNGQGTGGEAVNGAMETFRTVAPSGTGNPAITTHTLADDSSDDDAPGGVDISDSFSGRRGVPGMGGASRDEEDDYY